MGLGNELAEEYEIDRIIKLNSIRKYHEENIKNKIWVTKERTEIHIFDMSTQHLQNCINMLHNMLAKDTMDDLTYIYQAYINIMQDELLYREMINC